MNVKIKEVVTNGGYSLSANGIVNITLKASYSELTNSVQALQLLNNDVDIKAKVPGGKPMKLGNFRVKQVIIDGDGESTLKFNSSSDYVEMDNLNMLPLKTDENNEFQIMMEADIETEEEFEDGEE